MSESLPFPVNPRGMSLMSSKASPFIPGGFRSPTVASSAKINTVFRTNSVLPMPNVRLQSVISATSPALPLKEKEKPVLDSWDEIEEEPELRIPDVKSTLVFSDRKIAGVVYPKLTDRVRVTEEKWKYVPDYGLVYTGSLKPNDWENDFGNDPVYSVPDEYYALSMNPNKHKEDYYERHRGLYIAATNLKSMLMRQMKYEPNIKFNIHQDDLVLMRCGPRDEQDLIPYLRVLRCKKLGKEESVVSIRGYDRNVRTSDIHSINVIFGQNRSFPYSDGGPVDRYCRVLCQVTDIVGEGRYLHRIAMEMPRVKPWVGGIICPLIV